MQLRDYQERGVALAEEAIASAKPLLLTAATGTGKSLIELALLKPGRVVVTPFLEIVSGMLEKLGEAVPESDEKIANLGESHGIWTPIRLRNRLASGVVDQPSAIIVDECHHGTSDSYQDLFALAGNPPRVGFTATGYRGSPRGTAQLHAEWGEPVQLIGMREAVARGYCSMPECSVVPLLDDDIITVGANGEFDVRSANDAIGSRIVETVALIKRYYDGATFDKPTMVAVPSTECVGLLLSALDTNGVPACGITADSSRVDRQSGFDQCLGKQAVLVQIKVVSEGVDLPIRRLIDLKPTLSPVAFIQQFGRITRPGGGSEYVGCCRNLFRHCYLLDGLLPVAVIASEQTLFGSVSARNSVRSIGLEGLGKFKAIEVPFANGVVGHGYFLSSVSGTTVTEYACVLHPAYAEALCARRVRNSGAFGPKWERIAKLPEITGFTSMRDASISEKQRAWWKKDASKWGLDPDAKVSTKNFQVLPVMVNCRARFR